MNTAIPIEIPITQRYRLRPLFEGCRYDRVLIDSVLEGRFGRAYTDSSSQPGAARLDSGAFTLLGGDPQAAGVPGLLRLAPIAYVTPQTPAWRSALEAEFGSELSALPFVAMSAAALNRAHLARLSGRLPPGFELRHIDSALAEQLPGDLSNPYFFENFHSIQDFLGRGLGYCILNQGRIVCVASSTAQSSRGIDIEVETLDGYRRLGLATAATASLVAECLARSLEPHWLAANLASERLALKLGYLPGERYETLASNA